MTRVINHPRAYPTLQAALQRDFGYNTYKMAVSALGPKPCWEGWAYLGVKPEVEAEQGKVKLGVMTNFCTITNPESTCDFFEAEGNNHSDGTSHKDD